MTPVLPRVTLSSGAIMRWHLVVRHLPWLLGGASAPRRTIDVGCGRGEYAIEIARRFSTVELSCGIDEMGRDAAGSFLPVPQRLGERVRLLRGRFCAASVMDLGPFGAALCVDVLEHIRDDRSFMLDLSATVSPGGRLLVHVPAAGQWHPVRAVREAMDREVSAGSGPHVREGYTAQGLEELLTGTWWRVCAMRPTFGAVAAVWTDVDMALSWIGRPMVPLRALGLPLTVVGAAIAPRIQRRRGNGWLALAERLPQ